MQSTESTDSQTFIAHVSRIPIVKSASSLISALYGGLKGVHPTVQTSAETVETFIGQVYSAASPHLHYLKPIDSIANSALTRTETYFPVILEPTATVAKRSIDAIGSLCRSAVNYATGSGSGDNTAEKGSMGGGNENDGKLKSFKNFIMSPAHLASQYFDKDVLEMAKSSMEKVLKIAIELTKLMDSSSEDDINTSILEEYLTDSERNELTLCENEAEKRQKLAMIASNRLKSEIEHVTKLLSGSLPAPISNGYKAAVGFCETIYKDISDRQEKGDSAILGMAGQGLKSLITFTRTALTWLDSAISSSKQSNSEQQQ